jgi:hypothetical protein
MKTWKTMTNKERVLISIPCAFIIYLLTLIYIGYADSSTPEYRQGYQDGLHEWNSVKYHDEMRISTQSLFVQTGHAYANGYIAGYEASPSNSAFYHKATENVTIIAKYAPYKSKYPPSPSPERYYTVDFRAEDGNIHSTEIGAEMYVNLTEGKSYSVTNLNGTYYGANDYNRACWQNATLL